MTLHIVVCRDSDNPKPIEFADIQGEFNVNLMYEQQMFV